MLKDLLTFDLSLSRICEASGYAQNAAVAFIVF